MNHSSAFIVFLVLYGPLGCERTSTREEANPPPEPLSDLAHLERLVSTINDNPPEAHFSETPAVSQLISHGPKVIPYVLPLMSSDDWETRLHAHKVLEGVTMEMNGFRLGKGWVEKEGEARWIKWWAEMGDLKPDSDAQSRERAIRVWTKWINARKF